MRAKTGSAFAVTLIVLGLASEWTPTARAGTLHSLDLASLYDEAELIVLVEDFRPGGLNLPGFGTVKKVFKGEIDLGHTIRVIPWAVDFRRVSGVPGGELPSSFTAVFYLKQAASGRYWDTVFSGVRIVIEDRVFSVRPAGSRAYGIVPATPELLDDARPYDRERFQRDVFEAASRVDAVEEALLLRATEDGLEQFHSVLRTELRRSFPAATCSRLVLELVGWLADARELEALWTLRRKVPRASMGREVDRLLAGICTHAFIGERLSQSPGSAPFGTMLEFLSSASTWLNNEVRLRTLESLLSRISSFNERIGTPAQLRRIYATAATVLETTAEPIGERLLLKLIGLAKTGDPLARYYLLPVLLSRRPRLASLHFDEELRVFALVRPQTTTRKSLRGQVQLRRLASSYAFQDPTIVFQRRTTDGQTLDHYAHAISLPTRALSPGESGEFTASFDWKFRRRPLASGEWRMFLQLTCTDGEARATWSTRPVKFRIRN